MSVTINGTTGITTPDVTSDGLTVDTTTLVVDETNNRVGIGTASPAVALDISGYARASSGILFGTDTAAANALDDYEEGTWTPTVTKGTVGNSNCGYRKIGSQVTVWGNMFSFSDRTSADAVLMGGLPFTVNANLDDVGAGSAMWQYSNVDGGTVYIDSATQLQFYAGTTSGGFTVLKHNSLNNSSASVYLFATYIASS